MSAMRRERADGRFWDQAASLFRTTFRNELARREDVLADRERFEQCLAVLVSNAARFTADGHVKIMVERRGADWRVSVSDTGAGMSALSNWSKCSSRLLKQAMF